MVTDRYRYVLYIIICITEIVPENDVSGQTILSVVFPVTFCIVFIIITTAILVLSLHKLLPKCSKSSTLYYNYCDYLNKAECHQVLVEIPVTGFVRYAELSIISVASKSYIFHFLLGRYVDQ